MSEVVDYKASIDQDPELNYAVLAGQWLCDCGWANLDLRRKCRNCKEPRRGE